MSSFAELSLLRTGPRPHPDGEETLTVSSTAVVLASVPDDALGAYVHTSAAIRYWLSGTNPTASVGYPRAADTYFELNSHEELDGFKAIAQSSASTLSVMYWK